MVQNIKKGDGRIETPEKSDFIEIPIDEFLSGEELIVDLYICLSENKFIKIGNAGDRFQPERLANYKDKKVEYLFIKADDYSAYLDEGLAISRLIATSSGVPPSERQNALTRSSANVFAEIEKLGMNQKSLSHAKDLVNVTISFCLNQNNLSKVITHYFDLCSSALYSHSVAVSTISVMIGLELGWKQRGTIEKLGLGGLLHDIGLKEIPTELQQKPRALMTNEEIALYQSHAFVGMEMLRSLNEVPDDVVAVAYQHHEHAMGFGFPRHIKQFHINPYARVVSLANEFCNLTLPHLNGQPVRTPPEALLYIENVLGQPFWTDAYKALKRLIEKKDQ